MEADIKELNGGTVVVEDDRVFVLNGGRKFELKADSGGATWSLPYLVADEVTP